VTVIETRISVWEALAGRAPGRPVGPVDSGLWQAVAERLNPARARPQLRPGIEEAALTTVRGVDYVMLRSPDGRNACYLRLTPEEVQLAGLMDGTRTVARLVAEFARISGRLAPDQVTRVVADLAGNRMLEELPVDAFHRLQRVHRRPWPIRWGKGLLAAARGRRVVLASVDPLITVLYKAGGRLLFTRVVAVLAGLVALAGLGVFVYQWINGDKSVFLQGDSYVTGALILLGLNVFALACHELGHALAAKHAGRRVPAAGFLVYFGIPSIFVDTTDVWMAGRKARIVTTVSGPATGLILAGASQLVGFFVPELAPWTFKLAFAWYLNALFNLNPLMALDGYYLLMDWLEVPNLRARGLAWVIARLRRRPPRFGDLDREGRLVALYGMLAVVWLGIAANLAYRVYIDRVAGLVTGLWNGGWPARVLLFVVVAGLAAPLVYLLFAWFAKKWRRTRERFGERRLEKDEPRRLSALRSSALGHLAVPSLTQLAEQARWVHPRTGEQLVFAGAAQHSVYVVVDGMLEARRPGDATGSVRERVGAGGVVGLANALTGAPASLAWHTAGTTLLALPPHAVADAVGRLSIPPPLDRQELEDLLIETPALAGLTAEDRLGLMTRARPLNLAPGASVQLANANDALVVSSGVVQVPEGVELRRGAMIGPYGEILSYPVCVARTPVRAWILPAVAGLPLLIGTEAVAAALGGGSAPLIGAHPPADYPPLAAPPGPPPPVDERQDRRFERKLWWLLILLLLFALLLTGTNLFAGPVWAEMPGDNALLTVGRGTAGTHVNGVDHTLGAGGTIYVREGDSISIPRRSSATLTFRGGSVTVLCADTAIGVGPLASQGSQPQKIKPQAALTLASGRLLVDSTSPSRAFDPLALRIDGASSSVSNVGVARFATTTSSTAVGVGQVTRDGGTVAPDPAADLTCGDDGGGGLPKGSGQPTASPSDTPSLAPSPSDSASAVPSGSPTPTPTVTPTVTKSPTKSPTPGAPTKSPTKSPTPGAPTTSPPPPDTTPPNVQRPAFSPSTIYNSVGCGATTGTVTALVLLTGDTVSSIKVTAKPTLTDVSGKITTYGTMKLTNVSGDRWSGTFGPLDSGNGTLKFVITATDAAGNSSSGTATGNITSCIT
jgi:putative peptide zinc metalloprotease protein